MQFTLAKEFVLPFACTKNKAKENSALPTAFCHASTLIRLRGGGLFCCWFGGSYEGEDDVAIYGARRDAGQGWTPPVKLADGAEADWNPVLFYRADGTLVLFYKEGRKISAWKTFFMLSRDDGLAWSAPAELVPGDASGGRGPVRNKILRLASGRILAGSSTERGAWQAFADASEDEGMTWRRSAPIRIAPADFAPAGTDAGATINSSLADEKNNRAKIPVSTQSFQGRGVIQPSLWQDASGVHMLLRSSEGYIYRSDSGDGGETWGAAYATELPNNNSGLDLVRLRGGELLLVCNPVAGNWGERSPLSLFVSFDDARSWEKVFDLEGGPGEFSYPAIIAEGEEVFISYTWKRKNIAVLRLRPA